MEIQELFQNPTLMWFLAGLLLLLGELALPGVVLIFFGVGAWVTSISCSIFDPELNTQLIIFLVVSLTLLFLLRKYIKRKFFNRKNPESEDLNEEFIGHIATAESNFTQGFGKVSFKGTTWEALSNEPIKKNDKVKIISKESIKLNVKPLNQ